MFSSFWEWVLIIIILALVFSANYLHIWKDLAIKKFDQLKNAAAEKKRELENKVNKDKKDK